MTTPLIRRIACLSLLVAAPASAQFRDLSTRPRLDTAAISQFISSYRGRRETLFAKTQDKQHLGPLLSFSDRKFVAEDNTTLPVESATDLVTVGNSTLYGALAGVMAGLLASTAAYVSFAGRNVGTDSHITISTAEIALIVAGPISGALIGGFIGHLIPSEDNAAPMNAFRSR